MIASSGISDRASSEIESQESQRRPRGAVTRKITRAATARIPSLMAVASVQKMRSWSEPGEATSAIISGSVGPRLPDGAKQGPKKVGGIDRWTWPLLRPAGRPWLGWRAAGPNCAAGAGNGQSKTPRTRPRALATGVSAASRRNTTPSKDRGRGRDGLFGPLSLFSGASFRVFPAHRDSYGQAHGS